jgi:2-amino-4-hydroxy-6-hydroxymethyldihydropteridine diphosphokinase
MSDQRSDHLAPVRAYLSLGSNLGEREAAVLRAVRVIGSGPDIRAGRLASLYETSPVGGVEGGPFINTVLEVHSLLCPLDLLLRLKSIERLMGRSGGHGRAREIDIDIITMDRAVMAGDDLTLPHPRYQKRAFVLLPLKEIAPGFRCPVTGRGIDELIGTLAPGQEIRPVSSRRLVRAA